MTEEQMLEFAARLVVLLKEYRAAAAGGMPYDTTHAVVALTLIDATSGALVVMGDGSEVSTSYCQVVANLLLSYGQHRPTVRQTVFS